MGVNLISGCHKCKTSVFHYRGEENRCMLDFYYSHKDCAKEDINNVQTVMDNNGDDPDWILDEKNGGYKEDKTQSPFKYSKAEANKIISYIIFQFGSKEERLKILNRIKNKLLK